MTNLPTFILVWILNKEFVTNKFGIYFSPHDSKYPSQVLEEMDRELDTRASSPEEHLGVVNGRPVLVPMAVYDAEGNEIEENWMGYDAEGNEVWL